VDKGYLVPSHGNTFDFYETPQPRPAQIVPTEENTDNGFDFTADEFEIPPAANNEAGENTEINIDNINIKNSGEEKQVSPTPKKAEFYF